MGEGEDGQTDAHDFSGHARRATQTYCLGSV